MNNIEGNYYDKHNSTNFIIKKAVLWNIAICVK